MLKGRHYYNNGLEEHLYFDGEEPEGYVRGGLSKNVGKTAWNKNKIAITNGINNNYINEEDLHEWELKGWYKGFIYTPEGKEMHHQSIINTRKNKPHDQWLKDHELRSNGAKIMWENRTPEEIEKCTRNGLNILLNPKLCKSSTSKCEEVAYKLLCDKYGSDNVEWSYNKDDRYPFHCDFYVKSEDLFIELNIFPTHYKEPFDENNAEHLELLERIKTNPCNWIEKDMINVWANSDIKKFNIAKSNNLNYLMFYSMEEFYKWI